MKEERIHVLKMLEEGKVSADEAYQLLRTIDDRSALPRREEPKKSRCLQIKVWEDGEPRVNVNLPLGLARVALKFIPKSVLEQFQEIDFDALVAEIEEGVSGKLIEVQDDEDRVEVSIV